MAASSEQTADALGDDQVTSKRRNQLYKYLTSLVSHFINKLSYKQLLTFFI